MSPDKFEKLARLATTVFERAEANGFESLAGPERVLFSVWSATGQIENGGFDQFFFNSSGDYALEAVSAFRAIGATAKADVIEHAVNLFPDSAPPRDRDERQRALDAIQNEVGDDVFERLDNAYYAVREDVDAMLAAYVDAHADEIIAR